MGPRSIAWPSTPCTRAEASVIICVAMLDLRRTVVAVARGEQEFLVNPPPDFQMKEGDEVFVIAEEPPR